MFRCNDGLCLDNKRRCDGRPQCSDGSDEINCRTIVTFLNLSACLFFIYRSKLIRIAGYAISIDSNGIGPLMIDGRYKKIYGNPLGKLMYQWFSSWCRKFLTKLLRISLWLCYFCTILDKRKLLLTEVVIIYRYKIKFALFWLGFNFIL